MNDAARNAFRVGFAPILTTAGLTALGGALASDDARLAQGCTVCPQPLLWNQDATCECACPLAFAAWKGDGVNTNGDLIERFHQMCDEAGKLIGHHDGVRSLLNWIDDTPRDEMLAELLPEVELALAIRSLGEAPVNEPELVGAFA